MNSFLNTILATLYQDVTPYQHKYMYSMFKFYHTRIQLLNENVLISINMSLNYIPEGPIDYISALIGSDNGLTPNRRQVIIWTNRGLVYRVTRP